MRLEICNFLQLPHTRLRVLTLWRREAEQLPTSTNPGTWLHGDRWYQRIYAAFEEMFSNILDDSDSPVREVLFDLVSREAAREVTKARRNKEAVRSRPPQIEATLRCVECFSEAVIAVRSRPDAQGCFPRFEKSQWRDSLSRVFAQFHEALEETVSRLWPKAEAEAGVPADVLGTSPFDCLRKTLVRHAESSELLYWCTSAIARDAKDADRSAQLALNPEQGWSAYMRQAIRVSRSFMHIAQEMVMLTSLWNSRQDETSHLSQTVLRTEYSRVRRAFAHLLFAR